MPDRRSIVGNHAEQDLLLVLGASTRAAAFSALRAGWQAICGDLFADADLAACCRVTAVDNYPSGFEKIASQSPPGPWLYTGGLENHPKLVDRISRQRLLYGNGADVLRAARDPLLVERALAAEGLATPRCATAATGLPTDGTWLRKRRHSSGGAGVHVWRGGLVEASRDWYFQQRIEGESWSAIYVAAGGQARLLGVSEQLVGDDLDANGEFRYRGSIGPLLLNDALRAQYERMGTVLAANLHLAGLFGIDTVVRDERVWLIEINPRYTASVELFELATHVPLLAWHIQACRDGSLPSAPLPPSSSWHGKRVIYAKREVQVPADLAALDNRPFAADRLWRPLIADIPATGSRIARRHPVLTIFATASDRAGVGRKLDELDERVQAALCGA